MEPGLANAYTSKLVAAGTDLTGWTIVVDAANGAAYRLGPLVFELLGARVIAINAATYWHALRANNLDDRFEGMGRLLAEF